MEYMRQEPDEDPALLICEKCEDSGRWRDLMHECTDEAWMYCPAAEVIIRVEDCQAVENARYRKGR